MREAAAILREIAPELDRRRRNARRFGAVGTASQPRLPAFALKGEANLLVFPTLDAANITLTTVKAMTDALHVGPILLGTARPAHILTPSVTSRGVVNMTALAVVGRLAGGEARRAGLKCRVNRRLTRTPRGFAMLRESSPRDAPSGHRPAGRCACLLGDRGSASPDHCRQIEAQLAALGAGSRAARQQIARYDTRSPPSRAELHKAREQERQAGCGTGASRGQLCAGLDQTMQRMSSNLSDLERTRERLPVPSRPGGASAGN
jgi:hypothetical protein